ncbi:hypothetical protein AAFF_G00278630 [Aldrovandia affinis]|uniref:Uncharacterized protein n=1 Tax=Aldrovandia affinis TaxID=143900 RepID=A0AAD7SQZ4_9TELE|nr:hypothetical protein AAFF_G00278630 [Aldrovandia affinis]
MDVAVLSSVDTAKYVWKQETPGREVNRRWSDVIVNNGGWGPLEWERSLSGSPRQAGAVTPRPRRCSSHRDPARQPGGATRHCRLSKVNNREQTAAGGLESVDISHVNPLNNRGPYGTGSGREPQPPERGADLPRGPGSQGHSHGCLSRRTCPKRKAGTAG